MFRTRYSSFEFLIMPFSLTNAPASFQQFMNTIFGDFLNIILVIYQDDILIFSLVMVDHPEHVWEVIHQLRKHGLYVKPKKCEWEWDSVEFLGFHCSMLGIRMNKEKVQVILDWLEPQNIRDIQSFLRLANFYCHFIPWYSDIVVPMTRLLQKDAPWCFNTHCKSTFNTLKLAFTTTPILAHWIPDAPQIIETDALDYAIAAIHSIQTPDGELHPIAFHLRTLGPAKCNYDTHNKELLAIFELASPPKRFRIPHRHIHRPQKPRILLNLQNIDTAASTVVQIPLRVQPLPSFSPRETGCEARCAN